MYLIFKEIHSYAAALLLATLITALFFIIYGWITNKSFSKTNQMFALIGLAATHTQVLFGLILYFLSPLGLSNFSGAAMKDSASRLYMLEHPLMMILAVVLVTIGYTKAKKAETDKLKYRYIVLFYSIGLLFILSRIPWSVWI